MKMIFRVTKVDEAKREAWGRATEEAPDRQGEIFDYATSKPFFDEWSASFDKATDGKSLGNVRAMHGKVAAGKVIAYMPNDAEKAIDVGVRIVDENEWEKVREGVYTGFSIGGEYVKRWADPEQPALKRFTAKPTELSLVDLPAVHNAQFTYVKEGGAQELRDFATTIEKAALAQVWACGITTHDHATKAEAAACVKMTTSKLMEGGYVADVRPSFAALLDLTVEKIAERQDTSAKEGEDKYGAVAFADAKNKKYPIDTVAHIRAAWNYINKPKNAGKYSAEDVKAIKAKIVAAWKKKIDAKGPPSAAKKSAGATAGRLHKNLYQVGNLAQLLCSVSYMLTEAEWEKANEGDDSSVPDALRAWLEQGGKILRAMTDEEVAELLTAAGIEEDEDEEPDTLEAAAGIRAAMQKGAALTDEELTALLRKAGKKFSTATKQKLKAVHEKVKGMGEGAAELDQMMGDLGYDDEGEGREDDEEDDTEKAARAALEKRAGDAETELAKAQGALQHAQQQLATVEKRASDAEQRLQATADEFTAYQASVNTAIADLRREGVLVTVGKGDLPGEPAEKEEAIDPADPEAPVKAMRKVHRGGGHPLLTGGNGAR